MTRSPDWQLYERLVARMMADQLSTEYCVTPNARVVGRISRRSRQIDVLVDLRHDSDNSRRLVVDAKRRRRPVTINDVEASLREAEEIRAYVSAVRERQAALDDPLSATGFQQWADWALSQADRIDPVLSGSFRTVQEDD